MATATQPTKPTPASHMAAIQRRLDRWELTHLRALAASLHERVEQLEANLERARADAASAWVEVDIWRDQTQGLIEELQQAGREVGMYQSGEQIPMPASPGVDIDAVHNTDNGYDVREGGAA